MDDLFAWKKLGDRTVWGCEIDWDATRKFSSESFVQVILAIYLGMYAFGGSDTLNSAMEEIEDPQRTVPIAIVVEGGDPLVVDLTQFTAEPTPEKSRPSEAILARAAAETDDIENEETIDRVRGEVLELCGRFPVYD